MAGQSTSSSIQKLHAHHKEIKPMEEIKKLTFESACKLKKLDSKKVIPSFEHLPAKDRKAMRAHTKICIMVAATNQIANGGKPWKANHKKSNQVKYEARWYYDGGSRGFRYRAYGRWSSSSLVGSRLCFISYEVMKALSADNKTYVKLWNEYAL
jgi:hypothetical protein